MDDWLWPSSKAESNSTVRFGRAVHWIGYGLGAPLLAYAFAQWVFFMGDGLTRNWDAAVEAGLYGIASATLGRLARYVLANE